MEDILEIKFSTGNDINASDIVIGDNYIGLGVIPAKTKMYYKFVVYIDDLVENNVDMMGKGR